MKNKNILIWLLIILLHAQNINAQSDRRWAISVFGGTAIMQGDGDAVKLSGAGGLGIKYSLANNFAFRVQGFGGQMSCDKDVYVSTNTFFEGNVQALLNIVNFKKASTGKNIAQLYVAVGAGYSMGDLKYSYPDPNQPKATLKSVQTAFVPLGAGVRFYISPLIDLGFEYSARGTFTDQFDGGAPPTSVGKSNDFYNLPQGFITFNLGKKNERCLEWTEATEKLYDELIKAKQEAQQGIEELKKENKELTAKMQRDMELQMSENKRRSDSLILSVKESFKNDGDGDGVSDVFDKEPNTPAGASVDGAGRMMDSDKDGVPDHQDKCPTIPGKAGNNGCPVQPTKAQLAVISDGIKNLTFETGKSVIQPSSFPALDNLAQMLVDNETFNFRIEGHTDNVGNPEANMQLSQERAAAVKSYLVTKGVAANRITATGYGDTKPVVSNETSAGKAKNRRVDMTVE